MKTLDELNFPVSWRVYWEREESNWRYQTKGGCRVYTEQELEKQVFRLRNDHTVKRIAVVRVERILDEIQELPVTR